MNREAQLEVGIKKEFSSSRQAFRLDAAFSVGNEIAAIFGPSGAGKTTILECIAGLMLPQQGRIALNGRTLFDTQSMIHLAPSERKIGYVFQTLALFPHMTAEQNVAYGLVQVAAKERQALVGEILEAFRVSNVTDRLPSEMSGGERQRVALARSLVTKPQALLLDEPMSALDYDTKTSIIRDLRDWHRRHPIPVIYVTHAIDEVFAVADRVLHIAAGRIVMDGMPKEVLAAQCDQLMRDLQSTSS